MRLCPVFADPVTNTEYCITLTDCLPISVYYVRVSLVSNDSHKFDMV